LNTIVNNIKDSGNALVNFSGISKHFAGIRALKDVSFEISRGTCHAIIGENGAGKSTLGKILCGIYQPDSGCFEVDGKIQKFHSPLDARRAGIGMVPQELAYCPNLSVAENLSLANLPRRGLLVDKDLIRKRGQSLLKRVGVEYDLNKELGQLSTAEIQMVQIATALASEARIIVMDEPTSSLSRPETENLYQVIEDLQTQGTTIIYISHHMDEIFRICNQVTVLRDGQFIQSLPVAETNEGQLVQLMIGRSLSKYFPIHTKKESGPEIFRVENLNSEGKFSDITFSIKAGEVLGLAGLVGAGRSEIALSIFGLDPQVKGKIYIRGEHIPIDSPRQAMKAGIGLIPEDRKRQGLVLSMSARHNISLSSLSHISRMNFINTNKEQQMVNEYFKRFAIQSPDPDVETANLSGGNQQKIVLAKWLARNCDIIIFDEPTRGVDVGAKAEIHSLIDELACRGNAILLISSEMPEILNLSSRILVLWQGNIIGELNREETTQEKVMQLMAGLNRSSIQN